LYCLIDQAKGKRKGTPVNNNKDVPSSAEPDSSPLPAADPPVKTKELSGSEKSKLS